MLLQQDWFYIVDVILHCQGKMLCCQENYCNPINNCQENYIDWLIIKQLRIGLGTGGHQNICPKEKTSTYNQSTFT